MAITVVQEKETWNGRTVAVPYVVENEEADGRLYGIAAENAVATRCLLDWGVTTDDYDAKRLTDHAVEFTLRLDRGNVEAYEAYLQGGGGGGYTAAATYVTETRVFPPQPVYRTTALKMRQKTQTSGTAPDTLNLSASGKPVVIEPPAESDRIEATFPTAALANSFRAAMRACMHRLNNAEWHGHPAGCVMLLRAGAVREIGGLARVAIGLAIGALEDKTRGEGPDALTLSDGRPWSRYTEVYTPATTEFLGATVQTGTIAALYEHEVYEEADYDQLGIPYVAP